MKILTKILTNFPSKTYNKKCKKLQFAHVAYSNSRSWEFLRGFFPDLITSQEFEGDIPIAESLLNGWWHVDTPPKHAAVMIRVPKLVVQDGFSLLPSWSAVVHHEHLENWEYWIMDISEVVYLMSNIYNFSTCFLKPAVVICLQTDHLLNSK